MKPEAFDTLTCANCDWFIRNPNFNQHLGKCFRMPPTAIDVNVSGFPAVNQNDYCGEHTLVVPGADDASDTSAPIAVDQATMDALRYGLRLMDARNDRAEMPSRHPATLRTLFARCVVPEVPGE